jgi:hypothetical protein
MATRALKTFAIIALTGTSLSGCALIGGAADGAWSGTKYVAKVVSYPIRAILRDAPDEDTQFAEADVDADVDAVDAAEETEGKIEMMAEAVVEVSEQQVLSATTTAMPMNGSLKEASLASNWTQTSSAHNAVEIIETVALTDVKSVDVITVGSVSYVRTEGVGSIEDWRTCDVQAGGFWKFDTSNVDGTLNPDFETCMRTKNYIQDTQLNDAMIAELDREPEETTESATEIKPLP